MLETIHTAHYLNGLTQAGTISQVVEMPWLRALPGKFLHHALVMPALYACAGTVLAARQALDGNIVFNLGGGFHHAFADHGEGFCFYADAALAITQLRSQQRLTINDKILMIDLDAHRGNGFESFFQNDPSIGIFDMYNMQIYPGLHPGNTDEFPYMIPLRSQLPTDEYLDTLTSELPDFLDQHRDARLVFYNAGTDILADDRLGNLKVDYAGVRQRDTFVKEQLLTRAQPAVIMTSGGYSSRSWRLIADFALDLVGNQ